MKVVSGKRQNIIILLLVLVVFLGASLVYNMRASLHADKPNKTGSGVGENKMVANTDVVAKVQELHVPILMYHHVGFLPLDADSLRLDLTVSSPIFEEQLDWLSKRGYSSVTLEQVYLATQKQFVLPSKPIVFTFDDGYLDVFINAVPLLIKYNFVGSFAVVPGFFGQDDYTTWELVELANRQGMEIVSHTQTHFDGTNAKFSPQFIRQNLEQSLVELDGHLGSVPRILVYPYGHYTDEYIRMAKQIGFVMGLTTNYGQYVHADTLMTTPRVRVHGSESLAKFVEVLTGEKVGT